MANNVPWKEEVKLDVYTESDRYPPLEWSMRGLSDLRKGWLQQQYLGKIKCNVVKTLNDDISSSYSNILCSPVTAVKKTPKASMKVGSLAKVLSL